jgi:ElaB/YqjD/DUF883 family membrane-anchored ribosome-binding protein
VTAPAPASEKTESQGVTQTAQELPAEYKSLVEAEIAKVRQEYDAPGGKIAKIQSAYDKRVAEAQRQLDQARQRELQRAAQLYETDPSEAARIALEQANSYAMQAGMEGRKQEWQNWVQSEYEKRGFDLGGDQAIADEAVQTADYLYNVALQDAQMGTNQSQQVALAIKDGLADRALERSKKEVEAARKEVAQLPELVKREVARALHGDGYLPEATSPGGSRVEKLADLSEHELLKRAIAKGRAAAPIKK